MNSVHVVPPKSLLMTHLGFVPAETSTLKQGLLRALSTFTEVCKKPSISVMYTFGFG